MDQTSNLLLDTSLTTGLTDQQVQDTHLLLGYNEVERTEESLFISFVKKFWSLSAVLLEMTCLISVLPFVRKYDVAVIVLAMLIFNNIISIIQEYNARETLNALMQKLQLTARVLRNGYWLKKLPAKEIVPGDIIRIRMGDLIPADCIIRGNDRLVVDYSALTGESYHRTIVKGHEIYSGASVVSGEAICQVIRIGKQTYFGKTISLIASASPVSHTSVLVGRITMFLSIFLGVLLLGTTIYILFKSENWNEVIHLIPLLLLLLAGSIPVALPTMISVSNALGSQELAKTGVLTTRLDAIVDCARMDVLCCDKTGTITENKLSIAAIAISGEVEEIDNLIKISRYACHPANRDPIDLAFFPSDDDYYTDLLSNILIYDELKEITTKPSSKDVQILLNYQQQNPQIEFIPFDPSQRRFTTAILRPLPSRIQDIIHEQSVMNMKAKDSTSTASEDKSNPTKSHHTILTAIIIKGSVHDVLERCVPQETTQELKMVISDLLEDWAKRGWRSIAVAWKVLPIPPGIEREQLLEYAFSEGKLHLAGLIAFSDPPRKESRENIVKLQDMGITVVMLTGDALPIAREVAGLVGLNKNHVYRIHELEELVERESVDLESSTFINTRLSTEISGLAQVLPQDKYYVIQMLQSCQHVVGMTGDGVNDAAALKMAEVGIAMSNATDIAKKSASFVLTEPGLAGISSIVTVGRKVHHRIMTWTLNKSVKTGITTIYIVLSYLILSRFVVDAVHMVLLLVLVDFLTLSLATDPVRERESIHKTSLLRPQKYYFEILLSSGILLAVLCLIEMLLFFKLLNEPLRDMKLIRLKTLHLLLLYYFSAFTTISVRERSWLWRSIPSVWMLIPIIISVILLVILSAGGIIPWLGDVSYLESLMMVG